MIFEIRHLRLLVAIADHGTISQATRVVYLTQSAISHQLIDLEARVGAPLFHRTAKGMVPTPLAERVIAAGRRILGELAQVEADLLSGVDHKTGQLRIATDVPLALSWLAAAARTTRARLPDIDIQLTPTAVERPLAALLDGNIDLAVLTDAAADPRLHVMPLFDDEIVAVVGPHHRLAKHESLSAEAFAIEHVLVHADAANEHSGLATLLAARGLAAYRIAHISSTDTLLALVETENVVGVAPRWAVRSAAPKSVTILRLGDGIRRRWSAVRRAKRALAIHDQAFVSTVAAQMRGRRQHQDRESSGGLAVSG